MIVAATTIVVLNKTDRRAAPRVFQNVRFEQDPLSILTFKVVLRNAVIAAGPPTYPR